MTTDDARRHETLENATLHRFSWFWERNLEEIKVSLRRGGNCQGSGKLENH